MCEYELTRGWLPEASRAITSDDVFDYMLDLRALNQGIDETREERFQEYLDAKYANFQMRTLDDYQRLKQVNAARRKSQSQYVRSTLMGNARERSNGENAFRYFTEKIQDSGLYLLDEPENSLSPARQLELAPIFVRFRPVLWLPAGDLHPFPLPAGSGRGPESMIWTRLPPN